MGTPAHRVASAWNREASKAGLTLLRLRHGQNLVPLRSIQRLRRTVRGRDPLSPEVRALSSSSLRDAELRRILAGRELGVWTLGPEAIDRLAVVFQSVQPSLVIDFGSGVSTICLAYLASRQDRRVQPTVVALDQSREYAQLTREALAAEGLDSHGVVVDAPLEPLEWDGVVHSTYRPGDDFARLLHGRKAEMVVIDGPAAEPGARYATLPLVRSHLAPGALVVMDDALRDGELDVAARWESSGWIRVDGISLIGKGLLLATIGDG
jgi:predicted O-methyltransferase YrrM